LNLLNFSPLARVKVVPVTAVSSLEILKPLPSGERTYLQHIDSQLCHSEVVTAVADEEGALHLVVGTSRPPINLRNLRIFPRPRQLRKLSIRTTCSYHRY